MGLASYWCKWAPGGPANTRTGVGSMCWPLVDEATDGYCYSRVE